MKMQGGKLLMVTRLDVPTACLELTGIISQGSGRKGFAIGEPEAEQMQLEPVLMEN